MPAMAAVENRQGDSIWAAMEDWANPDWIGHQPHKVESVDAASYGEEAAGDRDHMAGSSCDHMAGTTTGIFTGHITCIYDEEKAAERLAAELSKRWNGNLFRPPPGLEQVRTLPEGYPTEQWAALFVPRRYAAI